MKRIYVVVAPLAVALLAIGGFAASTMSSSTSDLYSGKFFKSEEVVTTASVNGISYQAIAGTLVVHPKDWNDSAQNGGAKNPDAKGDESSAEASMFFVYYSKRGESPEDRPVTFLFNGGPGSSTVWLHMGAFGPRRVVTADDTHTPPAPYRVIDNDSTLLDASDLVFVDAPGTGFSRIAGKDKEKAFYGVDADAHAFATFIQEFISKYHRWNSPKYLFGESYGTPRSAVVADQLENDDAIDLNGVILLSQILDFSLSIDGAEDNPGIDVPYEVGLPTYAATAWYHHKLPGAQPKDLVAFVQSVERFAMNDYAQALRDGLSLSPQRRAQIAQKLHEFTGLPVWYILKANLRIEGGEFEQTLQDDNNLTTGRLDSRFSGTTVDPLGKEADYDPQSSAISSAYVSAFNAYVRKDLNYGQGLLYKPEINLDTWDLDHQQPGAQFGFRGAANVMPDLADAMKQNPNLKVMVNGGYFDLATPYYEGWYEMHHLPMPANLENNIEFRYYPSGHMVYAHEESLKEMHDAVADFIRRTDNIK